MSDARLKSLAERLINLADAYKEDVAAVIEEAKKADIDTSGLRRLVSWMRTDATARAEREAIDEQYRFLAGEIDEPATLPDEGFLSQAVRFYADGLTVRQVAEVLKVSVGKAHKLKTLAAAFAVHAPVNVNMNTERDLVDGDLGEWQPPKPAKPQPTPGEALQVLRDACPAPPLDTRTFDEIAGPMPEGLRRQTEARP